MQYPKSFSVTNFATLTREAELEELALQMDEEGGGEIVEDSESESEEEGDGEAQYNLPPGWHAILDEASGRTYYANLECVLTPVNQPRADSLRARPPAAALARLRGSHLDA